MDIDNDLMSVTTILTDLSEVLIGGIIGLDDIIAKEYGKLLGDRFATGLEKSYPCYKDLMRGMITEAEFWKTLSEKLARRNGLSMLYVQELFKANMRKTIPGTLKLYKSLILPNGCIPKFFIVSDHIQEYSDLLKRWHPEIFEWADEVFWSYDCGALKEDKGFFTEFLRKNKLNCNDVIFIDDSKKNIENAQKANILSLYFTSSKRLKNDLSKLRFTFR